MIATAAAILFGNGSVVAFNHFPPKWWEDNVQDGDTTRRVLPEKLVDSDNAGRQRLPSTPWKYIFTGLFMVAGIYLAVTGGIQFEIATLLMLAIVLEMAVSDQMYQIVPDQLQLLLAVSALGFVSFHEQWWEPIAGAGVGLAVGLGVFGLGALIFHKASIGGADIKFYTVIGLIAGRRGVLIIFVLTTLFFAIISVFRLATKRAQIKDYAAMMPPAFVAVMIYMLFLYNSGEIWLTF